DVFDDLNVKYASLELDEHDQGLEIQNSLKEISGQPTVPNVYVKGHHVGGSDATTAAKQSGELQKLLNGNVWAKLPDTLAADGRDS
ncbi:thioredoxin reductase, partial [Modicella reniformis]